jgi:hypothetical protein
LNGKHHLFLAICQIRKVWRLRWLHLCHRLRHVLPRGGRQLVHHHTRHPALRRDEGQGFQDVTPFAGPLTASSYFFQGKNIMALNAVHWVALAIFEFVVVLNVLFL